MIQASLPVLSEPLLPMLGPMLVMLVVGMALPAASYAQGPDPVPPAEPGFCQRDWHWSPKSTDFGLHSVPPCFTTDAGNP